MFKKNGFSLVEALIALSVVGIGTAAVATMISHLLNSQTVQKNFDSAQEVRGIVSALLTDSNYCSLNFAGVTVPNAAPAKIVDTVDIKSLTATGVLSATTVIGLGYKNGNMNLTNFELWTTQLIAPNRYLGMIRMGFTPASNGGIGLFRELPIFIERTGTTLTSCSRVLSSPYDNLNNGVYSKDCNDYLTKGWGSKKSCIEDGRWHLVYKNSSTGVRDPAYGTLAELRNHIEEGATVRVSWQFGAISAVSEICASTAFNAGKLVCIPPSRIGIATWVPVAISTPIGGVAMLSSGEIIFGADFDSGSPSGAQMPMEWFIRY